MILWKISEVQIQIRFQLVFWIRFVDLLNDLHEQPFAVLDSEVQDDIET